MLTLTKISFKVSLNSVKNISGQSKAVLMHHGMLGSGRNFRPLVNNSDTFNSVDTILIDSRNHGQSPHIDSHTVVDLADDLFVFVFEELIDKERKWKQLILLGHSMGGIAVMEMTKRYPQLQDYISRVVIVDMPCNNSKEKGGWGQEEELQMLNKAGNIDLNQPISQIFSQIQKIAVDEDYANLLKFNLKIQGNQNYKWKANFKTLAKHYKEMTSYTLEQTQWRKPVDVIFGDKSKYFKEDQLADFLKPYPHMDKHNFHKIEEAGHWVHLDNKEGFLKALSGIVRKVDEVN